MTIQWGSWDYGNSSAGFRVGVEVTQSAVSNGSSSVTFTTKWYVEAMYNVDDEMTVTFGGSLSGSSTQNLTTGGSGGSKLWATKTYTYSYSTYGTSPGTRTFTGSLSGVYNGANPTKSVTVTIPARPYAGPAAPSAVTSTRNSDTQATVAWTRNATTGAPYTSVTVQRRKYSGPPGAGVWSAWTTVATTSSTATSFVDTGISVGGAWAYQVKANNSVGSSAYVSAGSAVTTTPAAMTNVTAAKNAAGTGIVLTWVNNHYDNNGVTYTIQRSVAGGAYANVVTGLVQGTTTWTDNTPGAGTNQYKVLAVQGSPALTSADALSNVVSTTVPPLAPTNLSPNGVARDFTQAQVLTWQHNPGGDQAAQSAFTIETSIDAGANWIVRANNVAGTASSWTMPANTLVNGNSYLWRVRTIGITSAGYGPNSASASMTGSATPTVTITGPPATVVALPMTATWTYAQAQSSAQAAWEVSLFQSGTLIESKSGTGTTNSVLLSTMPTSGTYTLSIRAQSAAGIWSTSATRTLTINLLQPGGVLVNANYQNESGTTVLDLVARAAPGATRTNECPNPMPNSAATGWADSDGGAVTTITAPWDETRTAATFVMTLPGPTYIISATTARAWALNEPVAYSATVQGPAGMQGYLHLHQRSPNLYFPAAYDASQGFVFDGTPQRIGFVVTNHAAVLAGQLDVILLINPADIRPDERVYMGDVLIEDVSAVDTYFDGTTGWGAWTGTAHASTSTMAAANGVATTSATVERRVGDGSWVVLVRNVALPTNVVDLLPSTVDDTDYRVTAASATPTYRVERIVSVVPPDALTADDAHLRQWVFLNYGDNFDQVLRLRSAPKISVSTGREKEGNRFAGRTKPRLAMGQARSRVISVGGDLVHRVIPGVTLPDGLTDSPPQDWEDAGLESEIVCYRDFLGRRVFGYLSDVSAEDTAPGRGSVGFTVTESDYSEAYG